MDHRAWLACGSVVVVGALGAFEGARAETDGTLRRPESAVRALLQSRTPDDRPVEILNLSATPDPAEYLMAWVSVGGEFCTASLTPARSPGDISGMSSCLTEKPPLPDGRPGVMLAGGSISNDASSIVVYARGVTRLTATCDGKPAPVWSVPFRSPEGEGLTVFVAQFAKDRPYRYREVRIVATDKSGAEVGVPLTDSC